MLRTSTQRLLRSLQTRQLAAACLEDAVPCLRQAPLSATALQSLVRGLASTSWPRWEPEQHVRRHYSKQRQGSSPDTPVDIDVEGAAAAAGAPDAAAAEQQAAAAAERGPVEEGAISAEADELQAALMARDKEVRDLRERNLRVLADMENLRERSAKAAQSTKQYAIQGFVKDLAEVADNLQRAAATVPGSVLEGKDADGQPLSPERALALLQSLLQGVHLTDRVLQQTLKKNGVERYAPKEGDAFDADLHNAMFDVPAPPTGGEGMDPGKVAMLIKSGYTLNGRVVRPADVATFRAPS